MNVLYFIMDLLLLLFLFNFSIRRVLLEYIQMLKFVINGSVHKFSLNLIRV